MQTTFRMARATLVISLAAVVSACMPSDARAQTAISPVRIFAWARHEGCEVRYTYVVQNNGPYPIRRVLIGLYQPDSGNGAADLNLMPRLNGNSLWLATTHARSPSGWNVKATFPEDSKKFALEWIASTYHAELWPAAMAIPLSSNASAVEKPVLPGAKESNFSVLLTSADDAYFQGRANLDYGDASLNLQIEKGDITPPTLDLSVTQDRPKPNDGWAVFNVTAKMTDNYDTAPELKRPTAIANQQFPAQDFVAEQIANGWRLWFRNIGGRAYQAQFTAIDASGNATSRTLDYVGKDPVGRGNKDYDVRK
jgi:hypothetical protein